MLKSSSCDYSNVYIFVKGTIIVNRQRGEETEAQQLVGATVDAAEAIDK